MIVIFNRQGTTDGKEILLGYDDQKPSTTDNVVVFVVPDDNIEELFWDLCNGIIK